ncbi:hypothetical protein [Mycobacteroides abscessus]|uniref:hypothetical protein n=1 Tax=Mycobacteroides abscessus TaxID=36809 RepID=UPI0009C47568|nr:hypothetical protein [Mycobacteroides abscessus]SKK32511.1 Uncharacterised protein [Mycobacteroides abscessus subsp. abscessus]
MNPTDLLSYLASPIFSWIMACFLISTLAAYCIKKVQTRRLREQFRGEACDDNPLGPRT